MENRELFIGVFAVVVPNYVRAVAKGERRETAAHWLILRINHITRRRRTSPSRADQSSDCDGSIERRAPFRLPHGFSVEVAQ
jgi:hypothetical protein